MQKRRIVAAILTAAMMFTAAPFTVLAAESADVAVNKTATKLESRESTISLEVGASASGSSTTIEKGQPMAIEFVVDATSSVTGDANQQTLLDQLSASLNELAGKNVYVGLTVFTSIGKDVLPLTLVTADNIDAIEDQITGTLTSNEIIKQMITYVGTNVEAGIKIGSAKLDGCTAVADSYKHMVLVTDGGAYWWNKSDSDATPVSQKFTTEAGKNAQTGNTDVVEGRVVLPAAFSYDSSITRAADTAESTDVWAEASYVSNIEKGTNFAYAAAQAVNAEMLTVAFPYDEAAVLEAYAASFTEALPGDLITVDSKFTFSEVFEEIFDSVALVPAGSTITDVIGKGEDSRGQNYDFDIKSGTSVTLTIGSKSETKTFDGKDLSFFDGAYVLDYTAGDDEQFVLAIGEPILSSTPLKLTYTVRLVERGGRTGTHEDVFTNVKAVLDADGTEYLFPRPEVSFHISDNSGSGGKVEIQEPEVPQGLNGDDHFQYVMGYTDGTVRPLAKITRAEVAAIFYRLLDDTTRELYFTTENPFPDVKDTMWYNKAVSTLANAGIITGASDGKFYGGRNITRAELATIIAKFDDIAYEGEDLFNDISKHWARNFINSCADEGWIVGDGTGKFRPYDDITRAEVMTMINAVLNRAVDEDGLCDGYKKWPDNTKGTWYYYQVIEATNYHDYERDDHYTENWLEILPDKVWDEAGK